MRDEEINLVCATGKEQLWSTEGIKDQIRISYADALTKFANDIRLAPHDRFVQSAADDHFLSVMV